MTWLDGINYSDTLWIPETWLGGLNETVNLHIIDTLDIIDLYAYRRLHGFFIIDSRNGISAIVCSCVLSLDSILSVSRSCQCFTAYFSSHQSAPNTFGPMCYVSCGRRAPTRVIFEMSIKWVTQQESEGVWVSCICERVYLKRAGLVWSGISNTWQRYELQLSIWHFHFDWKNFLDRILHHFLPRSSIIILHS